MKDFLETTLGQDNPIRILNDFLKREEHLANSGNTSEYQKMRFVGYILDISFESATVITSDPLKQAVGGIPRGSFLIMAPENFEKLPLHFTLLRVMASAETPLKRDVQQTYFELHKRSMPELDLFTQGELQWGGLETKVLGMFYVDPKNSEKLSFSGDVNNIVSPHRYKVYSPTDEILNLIVNGIVRKEGRFPIGKLRMTECELPFITVPQPKVDVNVSTLDFRGFRTAMFGKTRLGKSNVVKLIAESIIQTIEEDKSVGQLIFDVNGEYANDNPQDGNISIRKKYEDRCQVYALNPREGTPSKILKLNFYDQPDSGLSIIKSLLQRDKKGSDYVDSFANVELLPVQEVAKLPPNEITRPARKILMYWAILKEAGFPVAEEKLKGIFRSKIVHGFSPGFSKELREEVYSEEEVPEHPKSLGELVSELKKVQEFIQDNGSHKVLNSKSSGDPVFDADDKALLKFLNPKSGSGPTKLRSYLDLHSKDASDFVTEILKELDEGKTVILDLGNATDEIRRYFSDMLSREIFHHQEKKFVENRLNQHFVQLYFEEAHNLFPKNDNDFTGIYARFAKEGAKFHIGIVYSTQSPSTINKELLNQTENFFIGHISSQDELNTLSKLQVQFSGLEKDILYTRTPGYMRMLTFSHRFVVPVQARKFE
ncbi:ATP-binding protein [Leptospira paudalimensis]|uniref:DUF87 domain-containing protein n=1 Tax=Leptospira paudalimensis TaxID=2950024 RepID=A0ABT3MDN9_9LEPT|nr:DUF87 domain-containing protein [Leptospira paudalimensis]MCW7506117.1 DUF87 domain-containing protein [Leptospira paudalimensis]